MRKMTRKNILHNLRVALNLSLDYALIAGFIYIHIHLIPGPFTYIFICWLIGIKQFSIGESLLHEASHGILFYPKRINNWANVLVAYPFFHTISHYRTGHSKHHKLLAQKEDPLLIRHKELAKKKSFYVEWFVKPFLGVQAYKKVIKVSEKLRQKNFKPVVIFWVSLVGFCLWMGWGVELFIYWVIPFFWCQTTLVHWSELTDHYMTEGHSRSVNSWIYNFLVAHNGGYHAAHHLRPNIPFYQLPTLQKNESEKITTDWTNGFWNTYWTIEKRHKANQK